jgi:hypothetical protein
MAILAAWSGWPQVQSRSVGSPVAAGDEFEGFVEVQDGLPGQFGRRR